MIVFTTSDEEVAVGDSVVHWEASGGSKSIGVWGQFSALHEESSGVGVLSEGILGKLDHTGFDLLDVNLLAESDSLEAGNISSTDDDISLSLSINTALISDQVTHGLQGLAVGSHDDNALVSSVGAGNSGKLGQG